MDETIGAKGGYNDKRRVLKISLDQKKKLRQLQEEKEIKELEKKVKRQQTVTFIKTLPIAVGGGTIQTLAGKKKIDNDAGAPNNIICVERTKNVSELVQMYNVATLVFNPTYEDNYPTVNLEAIACGTKVITYDTGGAKETLL